jgi:DNA helicase-2/ATP-dependent DNA helicase PcrA
MLVLAGPGSGKTRVITRRIARLVQRGVAPWNILAITFTNKAAREMAERVDALLPGQRVWVSTFHRFCARLLRQYGNSLGLQPGFSIYDTSDQHQVLRQVMEDLDIASVQYPPARIGGMISREKNNLVGAEDYVRGFQETIGDHTQAVVAKVYPAYQKALLSANAVDFDDLLLHVVSLLRENPDLRATLDERFRYVLVDEYQDTNIAQYEIVAGLSQDHPNLCVTGDPDQSIYSWRGAQIANILRFERDYPQAKVVRLEQNFRSTRLILQAADRLIAHNKQRKAKILLTDNVDGEPVEALCFGDGTQEADWIAREIRRQVSEEGRRWSDFAVFYRVNALSRELESALGRQRVTYQVAGGVAFYERAEVRDVLAYLRLVANPQDDVAFRRVVNVPVRGIGKSSLSKLGDWAARDGLPLLDAAAKARTIAGLPKKASVSLEYFARLIGEFALADAGSVADLLRHVLDRTGYVADLRESQAEQDLQRLANVQELINAAAQYDAAAGDERSLNGFLETVALVSETDNIAEDAGQVTLMTLHAAKGLEFPVVFIVGVENGLLPHERSLKSENPRDYEEERRLLFVGVTRAKERLALTQTVQRAVRGKLTRTIPSDFLTEMPLEYRNLIDPYAIFPGTVVVPRDVDPFDEVAPTPQHDEHPVEQRSEVDKTGSLDLDPFGPASGARSPSRAANRPAAKLMTGAELLARHEAEPIGPTFTVGMSVRHPRYGVGKVLTVSGAGRRQTVSVRFDQDAREESFIAARSPLQPVGLG